jgi:ubiquinone biosynthesis protein UbiJ
MLPPIFTQSNLNTFNKVSNSYADLMLQMINQNFEQAELAQEKFFKSVRRLWPDTAIEHDASQIEDLKAEIEEMNKRLAALEKKSKAGRWNRTGTGHFKTY